MKKGFLYSVAAIFVGIATMIAPLILLKPSYYELITSCGGENSFDDHKAYTRALLEELDEGEGTFEDGGPLERALKPSSLSSAGLMLVPSFILALGIFFYFKRRIL